jgi:NADPH:quinone reductase-like Zn-dependent oxidoreductase
VVVPPLPYISGGDAAGANSAVGPDVTALKPSHRVFVSAALGRDLTGCYAEIVERTARDLFAIPAGIGLPP